MVNPRALAFQLPESVNKALNTFEVGLSRENGLVNEIKSFLDIELAGLSSSKTYVLVSEEADFARLSDSKPFLDPITSRCEYNQSLVASQYQDLDFDSIIIAYLKPGTSDAEGNVALEQALLALGKEIAPGDQGFLVVSYYVSGSLDPEQLDDLKKFLFNPELYQIQTYSKQDFENGISIDVPIVLLETEIKVEKVDVANLDHNQLLELNKQKKLAANLDELEHFSAQYKNQEFLRARAQYDLDSRATDVEIETWFGLRSEHCFHKEFNADLEIEVDQLDPVFKLAVSRGWLEKKDSILKCKGMFKTFIKEPAEAVYDLLEQRGSNWIASMFSDNSGVVYYDADYMYCLKVETHNSPSNIEPVQGAKTGLNGNFRDIMGTMQGTFDILMGFFCYSTGDAHYQGWLPEGVKHPYKLLKGMTRGVREAGNEMQIPTLQGLVISDPRYIAKCLVYCGALGWSPVQSKAGKDYRPKNPSVGDKVFVAGQAVGIDGIHGATESSLSASKDISLGHVQADFSFIQVKVKEFILAASREGLFSAVTDFGAMGLGSASHEMARATGGLDLDLSKHPIKYKGIQPWQVNCSETQDRMLLVVRPEDIERVQELAEYYDVDLSELGELNNSGYIKLQYQDDNVALFDIESLFSSEPKKIMKGAWSKKELKEEKEQDLSLQARLETVLSNPDVAAKEWFYRQKDFSVKGGTIQGPLMGLGLNVDTDAALQKPIETEGRDYGAIAYAMATAPKLSDVDAYLAVQKSYLDLLGKICAIGGRLPDLEQAKWDAWAVCGNYCQPNSDQESTLVPESGAENLAALVREGIAVRELIEEFKIPIISGKDSMKCSCIYSLPDDFDESQIPAELLKHCRIIESSEGKKVEIHDPPSYLISAAVKIDDYRKCQSQEFKFEGDLIYQLGCACTDITKSVNLTEFKKTLNLLADAYDLCASVSYIHTGGFLTAVSKSIFASKKGAELNLTTDLFSEKAGRFLISIDPKNQADFENITGDSSVLIGTVKNQGLKINNQDLNLAQLENAYHETYNFGGLS